MRSSFAETGGSSSGRRRFWAARICSSAASRRSSGVSPLAPGRRRPSAACPSPSTPVVGGTVAVPLALRARAVAGTVAVWLDPLTTGLRLWLAGQDFAAGPDSVTLTGRPSCYLEERKVIAACSSANRRLIAASRRTATRAAPRAVEARHWSYERIAPGISPSANAVLPRAKSILVRKDRAGSLARFEIALAGKRRSGRAETAWSPRCNVVRRRPAHA